MGCITFTLDTNRFSSGGEDIEQLAKDIQAFINILSNASPDYVEAGNMLQQQLDEQMKQFKEETDPREEFRKKLDEMCPYKLEATDLKNLYVGLKAQIGEAMGPVTVAAFKLAQELRSSNLELIDWVWDFVKYYEEHWEF